MTEVQSAIGRVLARKLGQSVEARRNNANLLTNAFSNIPGLRVTCPSPDLYHAYYKYYVFVRPETLAPDWTRQRIIEAIRQEGVPCFAGSCSEIYLERAFAQHVSLPARLPNAKELGETSLMFLVHPTLSDQDIADTCSAVRKVMRCAAQQASSACEAAYTQAVSTAVRTAATDGN